MGGASCFSPTDRSSLLRRQSNATTEENAIMQEIWTFKPIFISQEQGMYVKHLGQYES